MKGYNFLSKVTLRSTVFLWKEKIIYKYIDILKGVPVASVLDQFYQQMGETKSPRGAESCCSGEKGEDVDPPVQEHCLGCVRWPCPVQPPAMFSPSICLSPGLCCCPACPHIPEAYLLPCLPSLTWPPEGGQPCASAPGAAQCCSFSLWHISGMSFPSFRLLLVAANFTHAYSWPQALTTMMVLLFPHTIHAA